MSPPHATRHMWLLISIAALAAFWCALIFAPPLMSATGHRGAAAALRMCFSTLCHQIPDRSFAIRGEPLAVCARCTGIYLGFLAGCLGTVAVSLSSRCGTDRGRTDPGRAPLLLASLPSVLEFLAERSGLLRHAAPARALAGALFGATVVLYFLPAIEELPAEFIKELRRLAPFDRRTHARSS